MGVNPCRAKQEAVTDLSAPLPVTAFLCRHEMRGTARIEPGASTATARTVTASPSRRGQATDSERHHVIASSPRRARQRHDGGRRSRHVSDPQPRAGGCRLKAAHSVPPEIRTCDRRSGKLTQSCRPFRTSSDYPFARHHHARHHLDRDRRRAGREAAGGPSGARPAGLNPYPQGAIGLAIAPQHLIGTQKRTLPP